MHSGKLIGVTSFLVGFALFLFGAVWLYAYIAGDIAPRHPMALVMVVGMLLVSTPFLAFPFSKRAAKGLSVVLLIMFAAVMLWVTFHPGQPATHPGIYQTGAIAFAVLLLARVGLALRRNRPRQGA